MTTPSDFSRRAHARQFERDQAAQDQARAEQLAADRAEHQGRVRAEIRGQAEELKRGLDGRGVGTPPELVLGPEAPAQIQDFCDYMDAAGWPNAQELTSHYPQAGQRRRFTRAVRTTKLTGYCIGIIAPTSASHASIIRARLTARRKEAPTYKWKAKDIPVELHTKFTEAQMIYLCKEDRSLWINPRQAQSLPLNNEPRWYDEDGTFHPERVFGPVATGTFQMTTATRFVKGVGTKDDVPVTGFRPRELPEVLDHIADNPAAGRPLPGFIPELHTRPPAPPSMAP